MSQSTPINSAAANEGSAATASPLRKTLIAAGVLGVAAALAYAAYYVLVLDHFERTDDAYVQANVIQITPQVSGTVVAIGSDDTDRVRQGQVLIKLDPADAKVALDQAQAQLAQAVREVRTLYANNGSLAAQVQVRQADLVRAQSELARAQDDASRRAPLLASGAVGKEEFNHANAVLESAHSAVLAAQSALEVARQQLASNQSLTEGTTVLHHPNVERAAATVRQAYLALQRATLLAPVSGYVAKRSVQVGQRVQAGTPLMAVVALDDPWVDANFKESQLQNIRIGQAANLTADVYGHRVVYHGKVLGLGAGTGAAFSLLPAQNATGNWIKVVQRVPVRIALDAQEIHDHPLRVGLSMEVDVDTLHQDGAVLADAPRLKAVAQTDVYGDVEQQADALVRRIIDANAGRAPSDAHHGA